MAYRTIETELRDGLLVVRQNRPQALNARSQQMYLELLIALNRAEEDEQVAAVLLTGAGRFFCAGVDLKDDPSRVNQPDPTDDETVAALRASLPPYRPEDHATWLATRFVLGFVSFSKPLFGAVNGPAIGEGFTSLLHCDVVYAAEGTYFWAPFARIGAIPEFCSTLLLPRRLGPTLGHAAMYLARRIDALEAQRAGFVLEVLPADDGFEAQVVARVLEGLALAGPPELRASTLKTFRGLARGRDEEAALAAQCHREMASLARRVASGESLRVREHYSAQLPGRTG